MLKLCLKLCLKLRVQNCRSRFSPIGDLKITSTSTERQKRSQNLAPVLVTISGNSLAFSRKLITSTGFYRCCAPGASAPVVVKISHPLQARKGVVPLMFLGKLDPLILLLCECRREREGCHCSRPSCQQSCSVVSQALACNKC